MHAWEGGVTRGEEPRRRARGRQGEGESACVREKTCIGKRDKPPPPDAGAPDVKPKAQLLPVLVECKGKTCASNTPSSTQVLSHQAGEDRRHER